MWAVIEVDEDQIPQNVSIHDKKDRAIERAVAIVLEGDVAMTKEEVEAEFEEDGYVLTISSGWVTAVVEVAIEDLEGEGDEQLSGTV